MSKHFKSIISHRPQSKNVAGSLFFHVLILIILFLVTRAYAEASMPVRAGDVQIQPAENSELIYLVLRPQRPQGNVYWVSINKSSDRRVLMNAALFSVDDTGELRLPIGKSRLREGSIDIGMAPVSAPAQQNWLTVALPKL